MIVSFISTKGGVGKSTLVLALANSKPFSEWEVAILDADPQGSLKDWYITRREAGRKGGADTFVHHEWNDLGETLLALEAKTGVVFCDLPGESQAENKTRAAMVCSDLAVIPLKESKFDQTSITRHLLPLVALARRASERDTKYLLLPTMIHPLSKIDRVVERYEGTDVQVLSEVMTFRKAYAEFPTGGMTLAEYAGTFPPSQRGQVEKAREEINAIARALLGMANQ